MCLVSLILDPEKPSRGCTHSILQKCEQFHTLAWELKYRRCYYLSPPCLPGENHRRNPAALERGAGEGRQAVRQAGHPGQWVGRRHRAEWGQGVRCSYRWVPACESGAMCATCIPSETKAFSTTNPLTSTNQREVPERWSKMQGVIKYRFFLRDKPSNCCCFILSCSFYLV